MEVKDQRYLKLQQIEERVREYLRRLENTGQKLPQHPERPDELDYVVIAAEAGVAEQSLRCSARDTPIIRLLSDAKERLGAEVRILRETQIPVEITYDQLMRIGSEVRKAELKGKKHARQQYYNTRSALHKFRKHCGLGKDDQVGSEMTIDFERHTQEIIQAIRNVTTAEKFQTEIQRWRAYYNEHLRTLGLPDDFNEALIYLVDRSGIPHYTIGRMACVEGSVLAAWYKKRNFPTTASLDAIHRLERLFQLPVNTLAIKILRHGQHYKLHTKDLPEFITKDPKLRRKIIAHLPDNYGELSVQEQVEIKDYILSHVVRRSTPFSIRNQELQGLTYALNPWPSQLISEFNDLARFKTSLTAPIGMLRSESWRPTTKEICRVHFSHLFGALALPVDATDARMRGLGLRHDQLTLALIACPQLMHWYLKFRFEVRGNNYNHGAENLLRMFKSLVQRKVGWLRQMPQLARHLRPVDDFINSNFIERALIDWDGLCTVAYEYYLQLSREIRKLITLSRNPFEPISGIVALADPMSALEILITGMTNDLPHPRMAPLYRATSLRRCVLFAILAVTGLRETTLVSLTYRLDNTGHLRREGNDYVLEIPRELFKVPDSPFFGEGLNKHDYRHVLPDAYGLYRLLDEYLTSARLLLLSHYHHGCESDTLFISSGSTPQLKPRTIASEYHEYTAYYLAENKYKGTGLAGVSAHSPHSVRHIRGTATVKRTGSFQLSADANHHSEPMARKHYSRFAPEDRTKKVNDVLFPKKNGDK